MNILFKKIQKYKKKIAFIENKSQFSFSDVFQDIKKINTFIKNHSIILILADNDYCSIVSYLASMKQDNITMLLNSSYDNSYLQKMICLYHPRYIFCNKRLAKTLKGKKLLTMKNTVLIETNFKEKNLNFKNYLLLTTSGTTGNPKVIRLSKENIENNTKKIITSLKITNKHTTITTLPLSYSFGLSVINTHFFSGATTVINNYTFFEKSFWNTLEREKVNSFSGVPQQYKQLMILKFPNKKYKNLKYVTQAGGKLDDKIVKHFYYSCKNYNIKFITMYGQTEASPRISMLKYKDLSRKIGSIGKPLEGYRIYLVDKKNKVIKAPNKEGELCIKGKNVFLGYANDYRDLKLGDTQKNLLFSGDLAKKDKENFFYITGRKSRIAKVFGLRFNVDDIEKILSKLEVCKVYNEGEKIIIYTKTINEDLKEKLYKNLYKNFKIPKNYVSFKNIKSLKYAIEK